MPKAKGYKCKYFPQCPYMTGRPDLLKDHYEHDCQFMDCDTSADSSEEETDWIPDGVVLRAADDASLVEEHAAAAAKRDKLDSAKIEKDTAAEVAHAAAMAAAESAKSVSMCGRLTLKELNFFSKTKDKDKYREVYSKICKPQELVCEDLKDVWDFWAPHKENWESERLDDIVERKNLTISYKSCNCQEHYIINNRHEAQLLNKKYKNARQGRGKDGLVHYYKFCEESATAFKNKNLNNPLYKSYASKFGKSWPGCRYCGAEFTSKKNYEVHEWKCKYNPTNLIEIPIFEETEDIIKQYDFFKPTMAFVNKRDIGRLVHSSHDEIIAYSLDADRKPIERFVIHKINKSRKPLDFNDDYEKYPFKHIYAFKENTQTLIETFNWRV